MTPSLYHVPLVCVQLRPEVGLILAPRTTRFVLLIDTVGRNVLEDDLHRLSARLIAINLDHSPPRREFAESFVSLLLPLLAISPNLRSLLEDSSMTDTAYIKSLLGRHPDFPKKVSNRKVRQLRTNLSI